MAEINYSAYLASVYPNTTWETKRLTGGVVNSTHRATRLTGDAGPASLVLKHAHPYVESAGPEMAFSTKRQVISSSTTSAANAANTERLSKPQSSGSGTKTARSLTLARRHPPGRLHDCSAMIPARNLPCK